LKMCLDLMNDIRKISETHSKKIQKSANSLAD
jgi:hypothetical protein